MKVLRLLGRILFSDQKSHWSIKLKLFIPSRTNYYNLLYHFRQLY